MKFSLSLKLVLFIIPLITFGGLAATYLVFTGSKSTLQEHIKNEQLQLARQTMDKLDRFLYERQIDVQLFASHGQMEGMLETVSPATKQIAARDLNSIKTFDAVWADMSVIDSHKMTVLSTNKDDEEHGLFSEDPWMLPLYQRALKGEVVSSDLLLARDSSTPLMIYLSPIRSSGESAQIIGVMEAELAWPSALEILQNLHSSTAELLNKDGLFIGDNEEEDNEVFLKTSYKDSQSFRRIQKTHDGSAVIPELDNPKSLTISSHTKEDGYLEYKGNNWLLALETPLKTATGPGERLALRLLIPFLAILLISVGVFIFMINQVMLGPISSLKEVVARLSKGDFSLRTTFESSDELGELSRGFNDMADNIQLANTKLFESNQEAQKDKRTILTLLENLPVGVLVIEVPSGKPLMMNRVAEEISGTIAANLNQLKTYREVYELVKEDGSPYPDAERPLSIALRTGKPAFKEDTYIKKPNDEILAVRTLASPIRLPDGSYNTIVSVFEDISDNRNLERSREEFFSIASHELRTPLTAIRGNTSLIQQYFKPALADPELNEMVSDIHESSIRLIAIVNDFLDTSRLEQKRVKYELANTDILEVACSGIKEYMVTGSRRKIHLEVEKPNTPLPSVWADKDRAKQVLINLVGNALKFTESGSITVRFVVEGEFVKTFVADTGQGMDNEAQQKLFRKFEQTGSKILTRDSVKGTGLGLYISKMIVEQMGGSIKLEQSIPGKGTIFSFSLPIANDSAKRPKSA